MSSIGHKPGPEYPHRVEAIIEIPRDSRNKYEIDDDSGDVWLDRMLFTATRYPANYGFIPLTYMWCAHTTKLKPPMATIAQTIIRYPKIFLRAWTLSRSETMPNAGRATM